MMSESISTHDLSREDEKTFSLVVGGPLYRLMCMFGLCDQDLGLLKRRVLVFALLAWLPLLLFSIIQGQAIGGDVRVPFLYDFEAHLRFLVAIPLFLIAEMLIHQRLRPVVQEFTSRNLIPAKQSGKFHSAISSSQRILNSYLPELCILFFVYAVGVLIIWNQYISLDADTWYSKSSQTTRLSYAGYWYVFVSVPIFQFLLLRWLFRVLIWWKFLWHVARIRLSLMPTHPDRMGGLGFLAHSVLAFAVLATAHTAVIAGQIANRIFYLDTSLLDFKVELAVAITYLMVLFSFPSLFFAGQLAQAKRNGLREYGKLAQKYVQEFDEKWLHPIGDQKSKLMGSADIQSLADLSNGYEPIRSMQLVPMTSDVVMVLLIAMLIPVFPLLLTMMPLEELAAKMMTFLF